MVVPFWMQVVVGVMTAASLGFWGWLAIQVISQGCKIADIEARMKIREYECDARIAWLNRIELKVDTVGQDLAKIKGALGVRDDGK